MPIIDKKMYEKLKAWCDYDKEIRPKYQQIMYVNSHDRTLTNATIRKMMFEMRKEDIHGELFISFYSAENFYRNLREYYSEISNLYMHNPGEDDQLLDIIDGMPPTCGWIVLIIEGLESLSGKKEAMQEMMESVFAFSTNLPSIVLVGEGDYKKIFEGCEFALKEMTDMMAAKEEDDLVGIGCYDQESEPDREYLTYESVDDQRDELNFYWDILYSQLEKRYFDYVYFKNLFKETLKYIIPRVSVEHTYRKDISLIENIGAICRENNLRLEGCVPWEFDAAQEFSKGLHKAIINRYGFNDNLSDGMIGIDVVIKDLNEDCGAIHISGTTYTTITVSVDSVSDEMDRLSEIILDCTYKGNEGRVWKFLQDKCSEANSLKAAPKEMEDVGEKLTALMDGIKEAADRTVNREPGRKVRRYKGNNNKMSEGDQIKILKRDYDVTVDKIKGIEKLNQDRLEDFDRCKLSRYIVVLDGAGYTMNSDGDPEMTEAAQKEYDEFVSKIRQELVREEIQILDEGYGADEDELEWHITACVMEDTNNEIAGIMEIDTCVRTDEEAEGEIE